VDDARTISPVIRHARQVRLVLRKVRGRAKHGTATTQEQTRRGGYRPQCGVGFQRGGQSRGGLVEQVGLLQSSVKRVLCEPSLLAKVARQTCRDEQESGSEQERPSKQKPGQLLSSVEGNEDRRHGQRRSVPIAHGCRNRDGEQNVIQR
jgi:hypothetical protein